MRFEIWWQPLFLTLFVAPILLFLAPLAHGASSFHRYLACLCFVISLLMVVANLRQRRRMQHLAQHSGEQK